MKAYAQGQSQSTESAKVGTNSAPARRDEEQVVLHSPASQKQKALQAAINASPIVQRAKQMQAKMNAQGRQEGVLQGKIQSMETEQGLQWYDDERIDLGFHPTKEKLVEVLRDNVTVPVFDLSGKGMERINELYGTKIYSRKNGPFAYAIAADDANGANRIEVSTQDEPGPVGYANFTIEQWPLLKDPRQDEDYTMAHVLGRYGKVAHLTGIYNLSMTREGPADIYNGFGTKLLRLVEQRAYAHGAKLIYLEPANAAVRKEPNTNEKEMQSPIGFYQKFGYGYDGTANGHNWQLAVAEAQGFGLDDQTQIKYAQRQIAIKLEGKLSKLL